MLKLLLVLYSYIFTKIKAFICLIFIKFYNEYKKYDFILNIFFYINLVVVSKITAFKKNSNKNCCSHF